MRSSFQRTVSWLLHAFLYYLTITLVAADVDAGFDVFAAAQVMIDKATHSWEWGTAAEALLELYNNELSVFGPNPFPNGNVPLADPGIFALTYAKPFINRNSQVLVDDSAVGDPASLGISAILLGQSDSVYSGAATRQADYILNKAPRWTNGAISHRPDIAELWADNMAMSFPFLAYLAVQQNSTTLLAETVRQCGLQRDVLKTDQFLNWQHIIGPQSQDTGLWSTGNGWASFGMVRVLHTLQKWPGSSSMVAEANQLKEWIKEILDGALDSSFDNGLLHNYLNDDSWFGEIAGTALLSAVAYRMAANDPVMFPQKYIDWANANRKSLVKQQVAGGVFVPSVDPLNWLDRNKFNSGSPEGQAFTVFLYTAFRDCVHAGICQSPASPATIISKPGIGPIDILTILDRAVTFTSMSAPPIATCGPPQSCDLNGCAGTFDGLSKFPRCKANFAGCQCIATDNTCGPHQSCDLNDCDGAFNGLAKFPQCTGNFEGCDCTVTDKICGPHQDCDLNGCAGAFNGLSKFPQCTGNFEGCDCTVTAATCGPPQSCDLNNCAGAFDLSNGKAYCTDNFVGCECTATSQTCGTPQSCDMNNCQGGYRGSVAYPQCNNFFNGCQCEATPNTCGPPQSCGMNGCQGAFDLSNGLAFCRENFYGCQCSATPGTCGAPQSCDNNNCDGKFVGEVSVPTCTGFFEGCECEATPKTCGDRQSCDLNGCAGGYDKNGVARCQGNFIGCECIATPTTCGVAQNCDLNGCAGTFDNTNTARCSKNFAGCVCIPVDSTCGNVESCSLNGCDGKFDAQGNPVCKGNFYGCPCRPDPIWLPPPPIRPPPPPQAPPPSQEPSHTGCVVAHCYIQYNIFTGDVITIQFYSNSQYIFYLTAGKYFASSDTTWVWENAIDPNGNTWTISASGTCNSISYSNSQQSVYGQVFMGGSRQLHAYSCDFGTRHGSCLEAEGSFWDTQCPAGANPPFCDYIATCDPWRDGTPIHVNGRG